MQAPDPRLERFDVSVQVFLPLRLALSVVLEGSDVYRVRGVGCSVGVFSLSDQTDDCRVLVKHQKKGE